MGPRLAKFLVLLVAIAAGLLTLGAVVYYLPAGAFAIGGHWMEGERFGFVDWLLLNFVPSVAFIGLLIAWKWPRLGGAVSLALAPLLLIEAPVMYGSPPPNGCLLVGAAAIAHLLRGAVYGVLRRRTSDTLEV